MFSGTGPLMPVDRDRAQAPRPLYLEKGRANEPGRDKPPSGLQETGLPPEFGERHGFLTVRYLGAHQEQNEANPPACDTPCSVHRIGSDLGQL